MWDFNGTVLDDLDITIEAMNVVLQNRGRKEMSHAYHREHFTFPLSDYYKQLGVDFKEENFAALSQEFIGAYMKLFSKAGLHDGVASLLSDIQNGGAKNYILSALEESLLKSSVDRLGIEDHFEAIYGLSDIEGRSKLERARDLLRDYDIDPAEAVFIGDTNHDMEVAVEVGMHPIAISLGHQSGDRFGSFDVYDNFGEIRSVLAMAPGA